MPAAPLVLLRAFELADAVVVALAGISAQSAERAIVRVMRARALRWGSAMTFPAAAVLYIPAADYDRLGHLLERDRPAMETRIAVRLDPDAPAPVRIAVRPHHARRRRMWVTAPKLKTKVRVADMPAPTAVLPEYHGPEYHGPEYHSNGARSGTGELMLLAGGSAEPVRVPEQGLVLGRGGFGPGRVSDPRASRQHARIRRANGHELTCEDLGSRNGTWVDGTMITGVARMVAGQRLTIGDLTFLVVERSEVERGESVEPR
jgi:hypothetical protein